MTVNERRNKILEKLCVRRHDTRENLAVEFGVSKRTIERDVLALSLEYPLNTVRGNGGGIYVEDWYRTNGKYLTDEQSALLEKLANGLSGKELAVMQGILKTFKLNKYNREGKK